MYDEKSLLSFDKKSHVEPYGNPETVATTRKSHCAIYDHAISQWLEATSDVNPLLSIYPEQGYTT